MGFGMSGARRGGGLNKCVAIAILAMLIGCCGSGCWLALGQLGCGRLEARKRKAKGEGKRGKAKGTQLAAYPFSVHSRAKLTGVS